MTNKSWVGPNGETVAVPKDDGQGLMISAFQSREFGFGMALNEEQLKEVNKYREGKLYTDQDAAMATRQHKQKKPLMTSPFIQEFEYGKNNDGYWTYQWMVCQLDDCVDVLKTLFGNQYDFLFMFDHSCGHDKKRTDGLIVENMAKIYGGKQAAMRDTEIKAVRGYLGPFPSVLKMGDIQKMNFQEGDDGPFWMSAEEKEKSKRDQPFGKIKKREYNIKELIEKLSEVGYVASGRKKQLQQAAQARGIPIFEETEAVIEGWLGKPKGLLQVAWERGFIDPTISNPKNYYTIVGRKNALGILMPETSLKQILANCSDFEEEETMLQSMGRNMGVLVDQTPKCHPELAGEGIEYSWGCAKNRYHQLPIAEKKRKEKFVGSMRLCLSNEVISQQRVVKFSKRAREYICAYHTLHKEQDETHLDPVVTPMKVEKLVKEFKTHRCALDFDYSFIKQECI